MNTLTDDPNCPRWGRLPFRRLRRIAARWPAARRACRLTGVWRWAGALPQARARALPGAFAAVLAGTLAWASAPSAAAAEEPPALETPPASSEPVPAAGAGSAVAPPNAPAVTLVTGERLVGPLGMLQSGQLTIESQPPRTVALADIERIELATGPSLAVEWLGQDNRDEAQASGESGGNKVQDIHLRLQNLRADQEITQVLVICQPASVLQRLIRPQLHEWRLAPPLNTAWRLALARAEAGGSTADLFLEPFATDAFELNFAVTVTYRDGSTDSASVKANSHTDHQLAVGAAPTAAPATVTTPTDGPSSSLVHVWLDGGERLSGEVESFDDQRLSLAWSEGARLQVPLAQLAAVRWNHGTTADADTRFQAALAQPGDEDLALIVGPDGTIAPVLGSVQGLSDGKLRFRYEGEVRSVNVKRLSGLVLARRPQVRSKTAPVQIVQLTGGDRISGRLAALTADQAELELPWHESLRIARPSISSIQFRNGSVVYLSDLVPVSVEELPYFGRKLSYQRDRSLHGGPLRIRGHDHRKGLAVHARCVLTYALGGEFAQFVAEVGFDESSRNRGSVACSVMVDGDERFHSDRLRGDEYPTTVKVPVDGAQELRLVIDFGDDEDTGDRVIWGSARLVRPAPGAG